MYENHREKDSNHGNEKEMPYLGAKLGNSVL